VQGSTVNFQQVHTSKGAACCIEILLHICWMAVIYPLWIMSWSSELWQHVVM